MPHKHSVRSGASQQQIGSSGKQPAAPPPPDDGDNLYSDVDTNTVHDGTYPGGRTLDGHGAGGEATHMLVQQGRRRRQSVAAAYTDSDIETQHSDYGKKRHGGGCCQRSWKCCGLWLLAIGLIIGLLLAAAAVIMYALMLRGHLANCHQHKVDEGGAGNINATLGAFLANLTRSWGPPSGGANPTAAAIALPPIMAVLDYHVPDTTTTTATTTTTEAFTTTTTEEAEEPLILAALLATPEDADTTTELPDDFTTTTPLPGVLSIASLSDDEQATTESATTATPRSRPAVGALRLPPPDPADRVAKGASFASRLGMPDIPDSTAQAAAQRSI